MARRIGGDRPEPPAIAFTFAVTFSMTASEAASFASSPSLPPRRQALDDLIGTGFGEAIHEALAFAPMPSFGATTTVWEPALVPVGEPFPDRPGYVTGLCGHAVAGSEWQAGMHACERCHGVTND